MQPVRSRRVTIPPGQWVRADLVVQALEEARRITPLGAVPAPARRARRPRSAKGGPALT